MFFPPQPRYRIYSRLKDYFWILRDSWLGQRLIGDDTGRLEAVVRQALNTPHAQCLPMARTGIFLAVRALIKPGQKVILSPYTISEVVNMVICAGGIPCFADLDRETCNINPEEIRQLIDKDTGAILITHFHGLACDMEPILELCKTHNLPLIEDAAQAYGTRYKGQAVGTFGDAGLFSLGMYKYLNCFYGGLLTTPHAHLAERVRQELASTSWESMARFRSRVAKGLITDLATWPPLFYLFTYWVFRYGHLNQVKAINDAVVGIDLQPVMFTTIPPEYLCRMTPMQARLILDQLDLFTGHNERRLHMARMYHEGLRDVRQVRLPPLRLDGSHTYLHYPIQVSDRSELLRHMMRVGRDVREQHTRNCADLPCFAPFARDCPNARQLAREIIVLPTYPRYPDSEVMKNIEAIRNYYKMNN
ncbi:MAG: DegT/DnrJ/EryC1/StrS family aminotransferase [Magnetococcales bacterium]|nr:DegT/DnrJ/EryC1/StrS family aminotransferase [Magnetococcales bacterium]